MGFTQPGIANQDDWLSGRNIVPVGQGQNLGLSRGLDTREVEVRKFLEQREMGGLDTLLLTVALPLRQFLLEQGQQETVVAELGLSGVLSHLTIIAQDGG